MGLVEGFLGERLMNASEFMNMKSLTNDSTIAVVAGLNLGRGMLSCYPQDFARTIAFQASSLMGSLYFIKFVRFVFPGSPIYVLKHA